MKYIDAEKLVAEIERLKSTNPSEYNYQNAEGYTWALDDLLSFLDTLSKEPDKSLEEEVKNYFQGYWPGTETVEQCNTDLHFTPPAIIRLARHFAKWGAEHTPLPEDTVIFNNGVAEGKRLMLEEAVECSVYAGKEGDKWIVSYIGNYESMLKTCKCGDKVRIIVCKKED